MNNHPNKFFVFLLSSASLLSVFANISWGLYFYYVSIILLGIYSIYNREFNERSFSFFCAWIVICSFINDIYDLRILSFILLLLGITPICSSARLYQLRVQIMYVTCSLLPVVMLLNLYAYYAGINYFAILNINVSSLQFSGYMGHPLWLAAMMGGSNIALVFFFFLKKDKRRIVKYGLSGLLFLSIYLSVVSGSRSALSSSFIGILAIIYLNSKNESQWILYLFVTAILLFFALHFFDSSAGVLKEKIESQNWNSNSRTVLWDMRLKEFYSSPIWGIGFATIHRWGRVITGTIETGSGWLTILSQTGIVGALFFVSFFKKMKLKTTIQIIRNDSKMILFAGEFIYLIFLSFAEGFIYTAGYCVCMMFWLLLGIFYEYHRYGPISIE